MAELPMDEHRTRRARDVLAHNRDRLLTRGGAVAAAIAVAVNLAAFLPPVYVVASALGVPVLLIGHALGLRIALVAPVREVAHSRIYAFARRWHGRLLLATLGTFGYASLSTPLVSLVTVPLTFASLTWGYAYYLGWTLERERQGLGPHLLEWLAIALLALAVVAMLVAVVVLGLAAAWLAQWAQQTWPGVFGAG